MNGTCRRSLVLSFASVALSLVCAGPASAQSHLVAGFESPARFFVAVDNPGASAVEVQSIELFGAFVSAAKCGSR